MFLTMSESEIHRELNELTRSGELSQAAARQAKENPLLGELYVRVARVEATKELNTNILKRLSLVVLGDEELRIPGLLSVVKEMRYELFRAKWTIAGGAAFGGFLITCCGLYIEWYKH